MKMQPADNYFSQWAKIVVTSLLNYEVRCDTVRFGTSYFLMWHFLLCDWMLLNRFLNRGFWITIRDLLSVNGGVLEWCFSRLYSLLHEYANGLNCTCMHTQPLLRRLGNINHLILTTVTYQECKSVCVVWSLKKE